MSTTKLPKHKVTFSLSAPGAQSVKLVGDFSGWEKNAIELKKLKSGEWKTTLALTEGKHEYRYLVDGQWHDDPGCKTRVPNAFGGENCIRVVE